MVFVITFILELILLFLLSRFLTRSFSNLLFLISKSKTATVWILSLLLLPGVLVHELSHFLAAVVLFVPVGDIDILPKTEGNQIRLGSVKVGKSDFIRRAIIGFAPLIIGGTITLLTLFYFTPDILKFPETAFWEIFIFSFILFEITNTMFSSRKDVEGAFEFLIISLLVFIIIFFFDNRIWQLIVKIINNIKIISIFKNINLFMLIPIVLNLTAIIVLKGIFKLILKVNKP